MDEDGFRWSQGVTSETWHLSGATKDDSDWCLDTAMQLGHCAPRLSPPERFVRQMAALLPEGTRIPWQSVMPKQAHRAFVKRLVDEAVVATTASPLDYYRTVWVPGNVLLRSLHRCNVDASEWKAIIDSGEGNVPAARSFEPDAAGLAQPVSYNRFKTVTGRLTVMSGPQILTVKREHRRMLRSSYGADGSIRVLDFGALEARILLYENGGRCEDVDLYGRIASDLGYDRGAIKGAVISKLYGRGRRALGDDLRISGDELDAFLGKVNAYFDTAGLLSRVKSEFISTGRIRSRHGRPVTVDEPLDNVLISYYGQTSGVDVTMLGFHSVVRRLSTEAPGVRPLFLLHDAIVLDVPNSELGKVAAIDSVKVPGYVQKFVLRLKGPCD